MDDYIKSEIERLTKAGKLDLIESLLQREANYQQKLKDDNYFEPYADVSRDDFQQIYNEQLIFLLHIAEPDENQLFYLARPSFEPENALCIERKSNCYVVTFRAMNENHWQLLCSGREAEAQQVNAFTAEISRSSGDQLFALMEKEILSARKPLSRYHTIDGELHLFSMKLNGELKQVGKHSPDELKMPGKMVRLIGLLISFVKGQASMGSFEEALGEI